MKKPILAIECSGCGAVYFGCALAYGVDEVASDTIMMLKIIHKAQEILTIKTK